MVESATNAPVKVLLIVRAPVGGLWRHVLDLTDGLLERGFELGIVVDSSSASTHVQTTLERFAPRLALGVHALEIPRMPGWGDVKLSLELRKLVKSLKPDIVHGHGAKGGLYARLSAWRTQAHAVYTPHGGSLHYDWKTMSGKVFLTAERRLIPLTKQFLFESQFSADGFNEKIGDTHGREKVVFNGLGQDEFAGRVIQLDTPTHDFAFVGEMRGIKGVDVMLEALCQVRHPSGRPLRVLMLGDGPMLSEFEHYAEQLGLADEVEFVGRKPVRQAFSASDTMVVPSRAESLPYIVIESIAAGKQVIASDVGGIGEIFGPTKGSLVPSDDADALAAAMREALEPITPDKQAELDTRYTYVAENFHVDRMVYQVATDYRALVVA
ncbi:MAG: glycosyltransferase [Devosiaceae bacterium]